MQPAMRGHCILHDATRPQRDESRAAARFEPGMTVAPHDSQRRPIVDLVYLGLTVGFFALSWAMVELFDRL